MYLEIISLNKCHPIFSLSRRVTLDVGVKGIYVDIIKTRYFTVPWEMPLSISTIIYSYLCRQYLYTFSYWSVSNSSAVSQRLLDFWTLLLTVLDFTDLWARKSILFHLLNVIGLSHHAWDGHSLLMEGDVVSWTLNVWKQRKTHGCHTAKIQLNICSIINVKFSN